MIIDISINDEIHKEEVLELYVAHLWSSAEKPDQLMLALQNSHSLVTARFQGKLVGLANAISGGYLVVYFPHMLVHPDFQRLGIGKKNDEKIIRSLSKFSSKNADSGC
ncbi:GNAT family N-acetyltransferase [Acinetobacter sichuanensis]|uniref:GNAT family N-acetyltransferase n=1 Tax=Acinetobacter sichuanensis TaxID=2136183 RepID=A0ABV7B8P8_9GAMM|nr:GNAT family N-acetyltransferase [Acinetobacter sichuanensis]